MDLIRSLLLAMESGPFEYKWDTDWISKVAVDGLDDRVIPAEVVKYHIRLLEGAGYISVDRSTSDSCDVQQLSWEAHDFIDSVRDDRVWSKTKDGALAAGGWTLDLLKELAKGYLKKKIAEKTAIEF